MLRAILSVVVGYLVMFLVVFALMSGAYFALGQDFAYKPGVYDVSVGWSVLSLAIGLVAAVLGGFVAATIALTATPARALAGIVLAMGLLYAVPILMKETEPMARPRDVSNLEAMRHSRQPGLLLLANAFVGGAGVLVGQRLRQSVLSQPAPPAPPIG